MSLCFFGTFFFFVTAITSVEGTLHRVFVLATSSSRDAWTISSLHPPSLVMFLR